MTRDKARKRQARQRMAADGDRYVVAREPCIAAAPEPPEHDDHDASREWWFVRWPCPDGCRSEYRAWDTATGSMVTCVFCADPVCVDCQTEPVFTPFARCYSCEAAIESIRAAAEAAAQFEPCINQCITAAGAWDLAHPGEYRDHSDGAMGRCANCDNAVCIYCNEVPAPAMFVPCDTCAKRYADYERCYPEPWDPAAAAELHRLAGRIASAGGGTFAHVNGWINRRMGVRHRREADGDQLKDGIEAAREWLRRLVDGLREDPDRWAVLLSDTHQRGKGRRIRRG